MELNLRRGDARFVLRRGRESGRPVLHLRRGDDEPRSLPLEVAAIGGGEFVLDGPDGPRRGYAVREGETIWVQVDGTTFRLEVIERTGPRRTGAGPAAVSSPMPGQICRVLVKVGDAVEKGQPILIVEAMKMQIEIGAPRAGVVRKLPFAEGMKVDAGVELADVQPEGDPA